MAEGVIDRGLEPAVSPRVVGEPASRRLAMEPVHCCICGTRDSEPVGVGEDFEYRTSPDHFLAVQCDHCGLVYLDPRPTRRELPTIYPDSYHAFSFDEERFGLVYKIRRRLEARRLLAVCKGIPADAAILDVGCGDGFHLEILRDFGRPDWRLVGIDLDPRAIEAAERRGITAHRGSVEDIDLPAGGFQVALLIQTIEHVSDPAAVLRSIRKLLAPGGRLFVVTDNTGSIDFTIAKRRHWGGYHFPRHWNLFNQDSLRALATHSGFEVAELDTMVSPVNWVYSVRNALDDWGAPRGLVEWFSLESPLALAAFTAFDAVNQQAGRGALLRAILRRPE